MAVSTTDSAYVSTALVTDEVALPARLKIATLLFRKLQFAPGIKVKHLVDRTADRYEQVAARTRQQILKAWESLKDQRLAYALADHGPTCWHSAAVVFQVAARQWLGIESENQLDPDTYHDTFRRLNELSVWWCRIPTLTYVGNDVEAHILRTAGSYVAGDSEYNVLEYPLLARLTWEQIAELRQSAYLTSFLTKLRSVAMLVNPTAKLNDDLAQARDKIIRLVAPQFGKAVYKAVISNLPGLTINPASIYYGTTDALAAKRLRDQYGWVFFLAEVEKSLEDRPERAG